MRMLGLGLPMENVPFRNESFRSTLSMLDFDAVVLDIESMLSEYDRDAWSRSYQGLPCLSEQDSPVMQSDFKRRRSEVAEMLKLGRTVVAFVPGASRCVVFTGQREWSGTGRNARSTRLVTELDVALVVPIDFGFQPAEGSAFSLVTGEPFASFWRRVGNYMIYRGFLGKPAGTPLLKIRGTDRIVGAEIRSNEGGRLLLIPALGEPDTATPSTLKKIEKEFFAALQEFLSASSGDASPLPLWADAYQLPAEVESRRALSDAEGRLEQLLQERDAVQAAVEEATQPKQLFVGTGRALELAVRRAFEALGCQVDEGEPGRTDFLLRWAGRQAVVEVKGVSKSAAEAHSAQLEKWASEIIAAGGAAPKPILVVNAFRDLPLAERTAEAFPEQMREYAERRGHALITGLQLLGAIVYAGDDDQRRQELMAEILETVGPWPRFQDWRTFMAPSASSGPVATAPDPGRSAGKRTPPGRRSTSSERSSGEAGAGPSARPRSPSDG